MADPITTGEVITIGGGSISVVSLLTLFIKHLLSKSAQDTRERDIETKSQLAAIFTELRTLSEHARRISIVEKDLTRMERDTEAIEQRVHSIEMGERTPSGRFKAYKPGGEK